LDGHERKDFVADRPHSASNSWPWMKMLEFCVYRNKATLKRASRGCKLQQHWPIWATRDGSSRLAEPTKRSVARSAGERSVSWVIRKVYTRWAKGSHYWKGWLKIVTSTHPCNLNQSQWIGNSSTILCNSARRAGSPDAKMPRRTCRQRCGIQLGPFKILLPKIAGCAKERQRKF
jgi:hypothetical protein